MSSTHRLVMYSLFHLVCSIRMLMPSSLLSLLLFHPQHTHREHTKREWDSSSCFFFEGKRYEQKRESLFIHFFREEEGEKGKRGVTCSKKYDERAKRGNSLLLYSSFRVKERNRSGISMRRRRRRETRREARVPDTRKEKESPNFSSCSLFSPLL